jgi:hypothetical protein
MDTQVLRLDTRIKKTITLNKNIFFLF